MLGRDTEWRQGDLLTDETAHAIGLLGDLHSSRRAVLISHDCDLASDAEPYVEVIVGTQIQVPDPMLAKARTPRRLHLKFISETNEALHIELRHVDRQQINKTRFASLVVKDKNFLLPAEEKRVLKQWLAARYGRPAFPNAFENRLRKTVGKKTVESRIAKILVPESAHLIALFFDLGENRSTELPDTTPYFLSISVVYDATEGGPLARTSAEKVANELRALFTQAYGATDTATEIALETCHAVADTFITLADLRKVYQWRLEYISLRETPPEDFLHVGELTA